MHKKKLVFISNMASPYQVKFCYSLQEYYDAEFWFYVRRESDRPKWWEIPLGEKCKVLKYSSRDLPKIGYFSFGLFYDLIRFKPEIILLGGFYKWHWLILKLAKLLNKKVAFMSEPLRYVKNDSDQSDALMTKENSGNKLQKIKKMFSGADLFMGMGDVASKQFIEEIGFAEDKVVSAVYPQDIEEYFNHPLRNKKVDGKYRLLFANRLIDRYNPILALEVFEKINSKYPNTELFMNNDGPLKTECLQLIEDKKLKNVTFLSEIDSWNNMHLIYKNADILILPASYSNGNLTIIEAQASGMGIVISNKINHMEKHCIDKENCYKCELHIEDFVDAIANYLDNPKLLFTHGQLSRNLVQEKKNEHTAKKYHELLEGKGF